MTTCLVAWVLGIGSICLLVPCVVFFSEVVASLCLPKHSPLSSCVDPEERVAVLVPAHNEALGLAVTINEIKSQLTPGDRLIVIADNCSDLTAAIAISLGAEVTVRNDQTRIGKGYALDWGLTYLSENPPTVVIIVDADCRLGPDTIYHLSQSAAKLNRPIQCVDLMIAAPNSSVNHQVAEFAWRVKNWVRPLGLTALNLPCQLMGTGMAFPWQIIRSSELASGHIAEDLKLGIELALAGCAPAFCPTAIVTSNFPDSRTGTESQRRRWEHGHISLMINMGPALLISAVRKKDVKLLALALDLMVPPLSFLVAILVVSTAISGLASAGNISAFPFAINIACLLFLAIATILAWTKYGRDVLPLRSLILIPFYMIAKFPLYGSAIVGRRVSRWIRSDRS